MPLDGTIFLLALHGTTPTCEAWTVTPTALTSGSVIVDAHLDHDELVFEGMHRGQDNAAYCTTKLKVTEDDAGWKVDDAQWFRTKAACQAAIRKHERVAMVWPCDPDDPALGSEIVPATKRKFDDVLAYGGFMYIEGECNRVRFESHRTTTTSFEGDMTYRIPGGLEDYGYEGQRGDQKLDLLGPSSIMDDGSSFGMLCGDEVTLSYAADHVSVMGNLYFDRASCHAATARVRYRESWLPRDSEEAAIGHRPLVGGC